MELGPVISEKVLVEIIITFTKCDNYIVNNPVLFSLIMKMCILFNKQDEPMNLLVALYVSIIALK